MTVFDSFNAYLVEGGENMSCELVRLPSSATDLEEVTTGDIEHL